jgi:helix-hairpin-helix protein
MKRWETYFITTALAAGLTGAPLAWAQQQMPKSAAPPSPAAAASAATSTTPSVAPASAAVTGAQVNINSADEAALTSVKGIGKAKAKAIIEYREKNGPSSRSRISPRSRGSKVNHYKNSRASSQCNNQL